MHDAQARLLIDRIRTRFEETLTRHREVLAQVGGNFLIHVPEVATFTVVVMGSNPGVCDGATEDEIAFALCCDADALIGLLSTPDFDVDAQAHRGQLRIDGDAGVFQRFLGLSVRSRSALTLRAESAR